MAVHPIDFYLIIVDTTPQGASEATRRRVAMGSLIPLCEWLESDRSLKVGLRLSSAILGYLFLSSPNLSKRIEALYEAGNLLPIGGSSVGAPLHVLSPSDAAEHIAADRALWRQAMAVVPEGAWNFAGCYDSHLPEVLAPIGIPFCWAPSRNLGGVDWGWTARQGHKIAVFGIDESLSKLFIWGSLKAFWVQLQKRAASGIKYLSIVTELQNFGARVGARNRIEDKKWLYGFSKALDAMKTRVKMFHPTEIINNSAPMVYPISGPMESLATMWGIQKNGPWEQVLAEHPEANFIHKAMLRVSVIRRHLAIKIKDEHPNLRKFNRMVDLILDAQSAQVVTPNPFGLSQMAIVRSEAWKNIECAQRIGEEFLGISESLILSHTDNDCDGDKECMVTNPQARYIMYPKWGGCIGQWRMPDIGNLINCIRRKSYPWHQWMEGHINYPSMVDSKQLSLIKENPNSMPTNKQNIDSNIVPDRHLRGCFIEHFYDSRWSALNIRRGQAPDIGDFSNSTYRVIQFDKPEPSSVILKLERVGYLNFISGTRLLTIEKIYHFSHHSNSVFVEYRLRNRSDNPISGSLGIELNWNTDGAFGADRYIQFNDDYRKVGFRRSGVENNINRILWSFGKVSNEVKTSVPVTVVYYPNEVPMMTLDGYDLAFQGTCAVLMIEVALWGGEALSFTIESSTMRND